MGTVNVPSLNSGSEAVPTVITYLFTLATMIWASDSVALGRVVSPARGSIAMLTLTLSVWLNKSVLGIKK